MSSGVCIWYSVSSTGGPVQSLACVGLRAPVCGPCAPCGERFTRAASRSCSVLRKHANMVHFLLGQWYIEVTSAHSPRPLASTRQARALDSPRHQCVETSEGLTGNCMLEEVPPTANGGCACVTRNRSGWQSHAPCESTKCSGSRTNSAGWTSPGAAAHGKEERRHTDDTTRSMWQLHGS